MRTHRKTFATHGGGFPLFAWIIAASCLLGACASSGPGEASTSRARERSVASYRDEAREVLASNTPSAPPARSGSSTDGRGADMHEDTSAWSVLIAQFPATPEGEAQAQRSLTLVRSRGRLPGAYLERRGEAIAMLYGRHQDLEDPGLKRDLAYVRHVEIDGERPYASAIIAPPASGEIVGSRPEWDLRNAKKRYPNALYTLQIGLYGRLDGSRPDPDELAEYRRAAEDAVAQLRAAGEPAFYYHGPTRSTVTVGIFDETDHDPSKHGRGESMRLRQARERHPYNLLNGKGIKQRIRDADGRPIEVLQKSFLVPVPE